MQQLKVTLTRSLIGYPQDQRMTVKALGLGKINSTAIKDDTPGYPRYASQSKTPCEG